MVDGGLRNISIGYQIHSVEEEVKSSTYTARDWEPMEISIVTVPADPTIGIGRAETTKQSRCASCAPRKQQSHRRNPPPPQEPSWPK
jgi:phage head maturation protease